MSGILTECGAKDSVWKRRLKLWEDKSLPKTTPKPDRSLIFLVETGWGEGFCHLQPKASSDAWGDRSWRGFLTESNVVSCTQHVAAEARGTSSILINHKYRWTLQSSPRPGSPAYSRSRLKGWDWGAGGQQFRVLAVAPHSTCCVTMGRPGPLSES